MHGPSFEAFELCTSITLLLLLLLEKLLLPADPPVFTRFIVPSTKYHTVYQVHTELLYLGANSRSCRIHNPASISLYVLSVCARISDATNYKATATATTTQLQQQRIIQQWGTRFKSSSEQARSVTALSYYLLSRDDTEALS